MLKFINNLLRSVEMIAKDQKDNPLKFNCDHCGLSKKGDYWHLEHFYPGKSFCREKCANLYDAIRDQHLLNK